MAPKSLASGLILISDADASFNQNRLAADQISRPSPAKAAPNNRPDTTNSHGASFTTVPTNPTSVDKTNATGTQPASVFTLHALPHRPISPPTKARAPTGYRSNPDMTRLDRTTTRPKSASKNPNAPVRPTS